VEEFIASFEHLDFHMEGMSNAFFRECFINGLKYEICCPCPNGSPPDLMEDTKNIRKHNRLSPPKQENPLLFLSLNPQIMPLLPLHSRSKKLTREEMTE
jgi:hypothetical protein